MYAVVLASAFVVGAPASKSPPPREPPPDGEWVAERAEEGGRDILPDLHGVLIRFGRDTLVTRVAGRHYYEIPVAFNTAAEVKEFDLTEADWKGPQRGVYKVDGDTLTMCVCTTPGGPRPTGFKADAPDRRLLVLKRIKTKD